MLDSIQIPPPIRELMHAIDDSARVVGGAVRDQAFGRTDVRDWDLASALLVDRVAARIGDRLTERDAAFGVLRGVIGEYELSVATFRQDGAYQDRRHPASVEFVEDVRIDALRRDFTINAIYADRDGRIEDPVDGLPDLDGRVLRAIGEPDARLAEDPLRVLRGVRFAAQHGLTWDSKTLEAARSTAASPGLGQVPAPQLWRELLEGLRRGRGRFVRQLASVGAASLIDPNLDLDVVRSERMVDALADFEDAVAIGAMLFDAREPGSVLRAVGAPRSLRRRVERIVVGARELLALPGASRAVRRRLLGDETLGDQLRIVRAVARLDAAVDLSAIEEMVAQGPSPKLIDGRDVIARGVSPGPEVEQILVQAEARMSDGMDRASALAELDACVARFLKGSRDPGR